jgi:hypothetical protein
MTKNGKKFTAEKFFIIFFGSKTIFLSLGLQQKKPSALKREHLALQNMKFLNFFYFCGNFCPPGSEYGSTNLIESGSGDLS